MSDLISRQAAIDAINSHFEFNIEEEYGSAVQEVINGLPSAEPVKHGHWIKIFEDEDSMQARCSACGMVYFLGKGRDPNYCGTCGADMREMKDPYSADQTWAEYTLKRTSEVEE